MDNKKLNIDDIEHINTSTCHYCGLVLTEDNKSSWSSFAIVNNTQVAVNACVLCETARTRVLGSSTLIGDTFVPNKTMEQCIQEIKDEGLTIEILKAMEEKDLKEAESRDMLKEQILN